MCTKSTANWVHWWFNSENTHKYDTTVRATKPVTDLKVCPCSSFGTEIFRGPKRPIFVNLLPMMSSAIKQNEQSFYFSLIFAIITTTTIKTIATTTATIELQQLLLLILLLLLLLLLLMLLLIIRRNPVPVPLCPPQIPHDLTQARIRASAVGSRRLTAWVTAPPLRRHSNSDNTASLNVRTVGK
jgi:hypothetical protein